MAKRRKHKWTFLVVYQLDQAQAAILSGETNGGQVNLDKEMVQETGGPGCWVCEQMFVDAKDSPCPGKAPA